MNQNKENLFALVKNKTLKWYAIINLAILYIADLILHFYYTGKRIAARKDQSNQNYLLPKHNTSLVSSMPV